MTTMTTLMTAEQLFAMPHNGCRYELLNGELRQMTPAGAGHGAVVVNLTGPLSQHVRARNMGVVFGAETGFIIGRNPDTVRAPDIAFVRRERIPESGLPQGYWPGAPDLAVEVVSPGDTIYEVDEKVEAWLRAGALAVWVVNPKRRTVTVSRADGTTTLLSAGDELTGEDTVPGFRCRVSDIFV